MWGFRIATTGNSLNLPNYFITVGNTGNSNDSTGYGGVSYAYEIGKYPVTNCEYVEFLNAVGSSNQYSTNSSTTNSRQ
jgi:hypothetical protein